MKTRRVLPGVILIAAIPPAFASDVSSSQGSKMGQTMQGMPMHRNMPCVQRWLHGEDRETPSHSVNLDPNRFHSSCGPFSRRRRPEVLAGVVWQCVVAVAVHQVANQNAPVSARGGTGHRSCPLQPGLPGSWFRLCDRGVAGGREATAFYSGLEAAAALAEGGHEDLGEMRMTGILLPADVVCRTFLLSCACGYPESMKLPSCKRQVVCSNQAVAPAIGKVRWTRANDGR